MRRNGMIKRIIAGLMVTALGLTYLPGVSSGMNEVYATGLDEEEDPTENSSEDQFEYITTEDTDDLDTGDDTSTEDSTSSTDGYLPGTEFDEDNNAIGIASEEEENVYKINADASTVPTSVTKFKNMSEWVDRAETEAPENTYVFTVATGATKGDTVQYFAIRYKAPKSNDIRTEYIFPNIDALARSERLLKHYAGETALANTYGQKLAATMNYSDTLSTSDPLDAWTVQDYVFQAHSEIESIESIDMYLGRGAWTYQGIKISKVDAFKGYEEYGVISGQTFLDFKGEVIAEVKKKEGSISTNGADSLINLASPRSRYASITNYKGAEKPEKNYAYVNDVYSMRMDFADTLNGGLETFMNYDAKSISTDTRIVEDIALDFQYRDKNGWTRKVTIPFILSSYGQLKKAEPDGTLLGFAQRGDTIAFHGFLPDLWGMIGKPKVYLGNQARSTLDAKGIKLANAVGNMSSSITKTGTDSIGLTGVSIYKGGCMPYIEGGDVKGEKVSGATLDYLFENKEPLFYYICTAEEGLTIMGGGSGQEIQMEPYKSGSLIVPTVGGGDRFLVTMETSDKDGAGTSSDINIRFFYNTMENTQGKTITYSVKNEAYEYMGQWPTVSGGDFISESGLVRNGSISFFIEADNLQEFTGIEFNVGGTTGWDMKNLKIYYVEKYDKRRAYCTPYEMAGARTNFWMDRSMISAEIFNLKDVEFSLVGEDGSQKDEAGNGIGGKIQKVDEEGNPVFDKEGNPVYEDIDNGTGSKNKTTRIDEGLYFNPGTTTIGFNSGSIADVRTSSYSDVRYSMTYEQTGVNWGFFKKKKTFDIDVKVAKDPDYDNGNGDSGSKNYFYFQLVFKNGRSGYVLANQQLTSDGFRANKDEIFSISVNQDYGELVAVRIIPEDIDEESDVFDKLNIERITVSEQTSGGSYLSYVIDQVGWIEIDYRDANEGASLRTQKARMESEIARLFKVSYQQRSVKILCEIETQPWDGNVKQFMGSIMATLYYIDKDGNARDVSFDVVSRMADYAKKACDTVDTIKSDGIDKTVANENMLYITDQSYMMRPGHTDRFILPAITDLKSIVSIEFTCQTRNNSGAIWNIGSVGMSLVNKDGPIQLTYNGDYVRNLTTQQLCINKEKDLHYEIGIGVVEPLSPAIEFFDNEIVWSSDEWVTPVSRIPESEDDTVNIFVYPSEGANNASGASVGIDLKYNIPFSQVMTTKASKLQLSDDANGKAVYFVKGLRASNFVNAGELTVKCVNSSMAFDHAIVQHVREGVVVNTYAYNFLGASAIRGTSANVMISNKYIDNTEEKVAISFGEGTGTQNLSPVNHDVAVAFIYTTTLDNTNSEYQSPFMYLTDAGYDEMREGLFAELEYDVPFVKQITGYVIAGYGNMTGDQSVYVDGACAQVYNVDKEELMPSSGQLETVERSKRSYASFLEEPYYLVERVVRHDATSDLPYDRGGITPIEITFDTAGEAVAENVTDTTEKSFGVRMIFTYQDCRGNDETKILKDATYYIQGDTQRFLSGSSQTVKFFLREMSQDMSIYSVDIYPFNPEVVITGEHTDGIDPETIDDITTSELINQKTGGGETADLSRPENADLVQQIMNRRSVSWTISHVKVDFGFGARIPIEKTITQEFSGMDTGDVLILSEIVLHTNIGLNDERKTAIKNHTHKMVAVSDDVIKGITWIEQSTAGFNVKAYKMIDDAREDVTADTVEIDYETKSFKFTVPKNDTKDIVKYEIEISAVDAPSIFDLITVNVKPDEEEKKDEMDDELNNNDAENATTEATTQATTEATTEATTQTTEAATEAPADTSSTETPSNVPSDTAPADSSSSDTAPADSSSSDTAPADASTDTAPADASTDTAPTDSSSSDTAPAD